MPWGSWWRFSILKLLFLHDKAPKSHFPGLKGVSKLYFNFFDLDEIFFFSLITLVKDPSCIQNRHNWANDHMRARGWKETKIKDDPGPQNETKTDGCPNAYKWDLNERRSQANNCGFDWRTLPGLEKRLKLRTLMVDNIWKLRSWKVHKKR